MAVISLAINRARKLRDARGPRKKMTIEQEAKYFGSNRLLLDQEVPDEYLLTKLQLE